MHTAQSTDRNCRRGGGAEGIACLFVLVVAVVFLGPLACSERKEAGQDPPARSGGATVEVETTSEREGPPFANPFGLMPQIPKAGKIAKGLGVAHLRGIARWEWLEPKRGRWISDSKTAKWIDESKRNGLRLIPSVRIGQGWASAKSRDGIGRTTSVPPADLSEQWSEEWGYSKSYYGFIHKFVKSRRDDLDAIIVENEANTPHFWYGTADEYVRVLKTAYLAAHRAKPEIIVMNSGCASGAWAVCVIRDMLEDPRIGPEKVLGFANGYFAKLKNPKFQWRDAGDLETLARRKDVRENYERITHYLANYEGCVDLFNLHYYEDYHYLEDVLTWIRGRAKAAGYDLPPMAITEYGIRNVDQSYRVEGADHALEVVKKLVVALSLDARLIVWYSLRDDMVQKVGLLDDDRSERMAARAFRFAVGKIGSRYRFASRALGAQGLWRFRFDHVKDGRKSLDVVWSEGGSLPYQLGAKGDSEKRKVYTLMGEKIRPEEKDGGEEIHVSVSPVFVEREKTGSEL